MDKTTVQVALFQEGDLVPGSAAKLMGARIEGLEIVELDVSGVSAIGQGFTDEPFGVWVDEHPGIRPVPTNANPAIGATVAAVER